MMNKEKLAVLNSRKKQSTFHKMVMDKNKGNKKKRST